MQNFHFIFNAPPARPSARSAISEVFAWAVWRAMQLAARDLIFDETDDGLVVAFIDEKTRDAFGQPFRRELARFPHLRGAALVGFPAKGRGTAALDDLKWEVRTWTGYKTTDTGERTCTVVQFVPPGLV